jgi:hypothetical protein
MARVICTHRHASGSINGVRFDVHALGRISEEISEERAECFLAIPGYVSEDGSAAAKVESTEERNAETGNFMPSSFADQHPQMPTSLQDASPGWEKKPEQADGGEGIGKDAAGAKPPFKKK